MTDSKKKERLFLIAMFVSMAIWGISWSSAKVLSSYGSALSIAYIRFSIVVVALIPLLHFMKIGFKIKKGGVKYVVASGIVMGLYSVSFFAGLKNGTASAGGVVVTILNPLLAFVMGLFISRRVPQKVETIGLLVGLLAGAFLLHVWDKFEEVFDLGNTLFIIAAFLWAMLSQITSRSAPYGHALSFNFWLHVVTVTGMSLKADFHEIHTILSTGDSVFWGNILYFGIINSTFATTCYFYATTFLGAERASSFIFLVPAGAICSSALILGESVSWYTVVGGFLGVFAVLLINGKLKRSNSTV